MPFSQLGLSDSILEAITKKGYDKPSPIQEKAIPLILEGKDVMAAAQTGTGKTAGFTLPILQILSKGQPTKSNQVRTLILTPTRELAAQVQDSVSTYGKHLPLKSAVVFGGVKINPQMQKLRGGVDILVATPGRLIDLYSQNAVKFDQLEIIVFDEADRMLDMGFIHDIKRILKILPAKRQTLMFSATFSDEIRKLAKSLVHDPVEVSVTPRNSAVKSVKQWIHPVDKSKKQALLTKLIQDHGWYQVLVFSRTKHGANRIANELGKKGISASAIHGNKSQAARTRALADFKAGKVNVLVATDIAARGIDIVELPHVVNFDLPHVPEDYVHRIGRTGRAGSKGEAISLVSADEAGQLFDIERLTQKKLERIMVDDFTPKHNVPESAKNILPPKKKKPKKSNSRNKPRYGKDNNSTDKKTNKKKSFWDNKPKKKTSK
ncbi:DEAD/DEAH box helicase [Candidatus Thioglobus sp.]|uniref:DEAD/DEAH box helicase n=1 Tax=Candidatus Thioglobus sp. TaxID=2026721 RepID=UPI003D12CEC5